MIHPLFLFCLMKQLDTILRGRFPTSFFFGSLRGIIGLVRDIRRNRIQSMVVQFLADFNFYDKKIVFERSIPNDLKSYIQKYIKQGFQTMKRVKRISKKYPMSEHNW